MPVVACGSDAAGAGAKTRLLPLGATAEIKLFDVEFTVLIVMVLPVGLNVYPAKNGVTV